MRILAAFLCAAPLFAQQLSVEGLWVGSLEVGAVKLRLAFHLDGKGAGTFDSLDQGAKGIPLDSVKLEGTHVSITSRKVGGTYEAELLDGGKRLQGIWKQGTPLPLVLVRSASLPEVKRPQTPQPPFPYTSEEVSYPSVNPSVQLAATLTIPQGKGPFPAVVMITGSGAQDRDETLLGHKPFWVIADYLSRHGIAVLRADDRGTAKSTGSFAKSTSADFADDAEGGVKFLAARKEIGKIGLIGHSEGGMIAPMIANRNPRVGFVVLLAGTSVRGDELLLEQNRLLMVNSGLIETTATLARVKKLYDIITSNADPKVAAEKATEAFPEPQAKSQIDTLNSPWFRWMLAYDPGTALQRLQQPALVFNGTLDLQVSAEQNLPVFAKKLAEAHNTDFKIMKMPGLNHLFQHCKTGSPKEYADIEETFSPEVLQIMSEWINGHKE